MDLLLQMYHKNKRLSNKFGIDELLTAKIEELEVDCSLIFINTDV